MTRSILLLTVSGVVTILVGCSLTITYGASAPGRREKCFSGLCIFSSKETKAVIMKILKVG